MSDKVFNINIVPGRSTIGHTVIQCCGKGVQQDWEYCPYCREAIQWPPTPHELAKRAAREVEHERRMAEDSKYRAGYEAEQALNRLMFGKILEDYAKCDDPFLGLAGRPE